MTNDMSTTPTHFPDDTDAVLAAAEALGTLEEALGHPEWGVRLAAAGLAFERLEAIERRDLDRDRQRLDQAMAIARELAALPPVERESMAAALLEVRYLRAVADDATPLAEVTAMYQEVRAALGRLGDRQAGDGEGA